MKNLFSPRNYGLQVRRAVQQYQSQTGEGYRAIAKRIGTSAATLSRTCNGKPPNVETYLRMNKWMQSGEKK